MVRVFVLGNGSFRKDTGNGYTKFWMHLMLLKL